MRERWCKFLFERIAMLVAFPTHIEVIALLLRQIPCRIAVINAITP